MKSKSTKFLCMHYAILFCCLFSSASIFAQLSWTQKANFGGTVRYSANGFSIGANGYIGTGKNLSTGIAYSDFWEYNSLNDTWTQKADVGGSPRWDPATFVIDGYGYLGTGLTNAGYVSDFWKYDPSANTWVQVAAFGGGGRQGAVAFSNNGLAYMGTGYASGYKSDFWKYDPSIDTWSQVAAFGGVSRSDARGFVLNNKFFVGTGWNGTALSDFWEYEPTTNAWLQKADFPGTARFSATAFEIANKGYFGNGKNSGADFYTDFWEYEPSNDTWAQSDSFTGAGRAYAVGFSIGNKGYVGTGMAAGNTFFNDFFEFGPSCSMSVSVSAGNAICALSGTASATVTGGTSPYFYQWSMGANGSDISGLAPGNYSLTVTDNNGCSASSGFSIGGCVDSWTQKANFGGMARYSANGFSIGTNGYIGTGKNLSTGIAYSDFWEYNSLNDTWTQKADVGGSARWDPATFVINGYGYLGTGLTNAGYISDFWKYDPSANTWVQVAAFGGGGRQGAVAFSNNGLAYMGTGYASGYKSDFWKYDPTIDSWSQVAAFGGVSRSDARGFVLNNKFIVGTGWNGTALSDFWEYEPTTNAWLQKADFPGTARFSATAFEIANKGYFGNGRNSGSDYYTDFWAYEPSDDSWAQISSFTGAGRAYAVGFSIGNKGYVGTGMAAGNTFFNDFFEFGPCSGQINIAYVKTDNACNGDSSGNIDITVSGGVPPYVFLWSDSSTIEDLSGLSAVNYTVSVSDANNCSESISVSIGEPTAIISSLSVSNITCNGANNGAISSAVSGGISPYMYQWSNSEITGNIDSLGNGNYSVAITDSNGCSVTDSALITEPLLITLSLLSANITCNGDYGSASITVNGGNPPFTFLWNNGASTNINSGLPAGTFYVTATDSNGCSKNDSVVISEPQALFISGSVINASCNGASTGSATITASGGTSPYSYLWSNGGTAATESNLPAGNYSVTVTDYNNCVEISAYNISEPAALTISVSSNTATCGLSNGSASALVAGGYPPYSYLWNNSMTSSIITGLAAGSYSVTVTDSLGCIISQNMNVSNTVPVVSMTSTDVTCNGDSIGSATITASGGTTPYAYSWSNGVSTNSVSGLTAGAYIASVTDGSGCLAIDNVTINEPSALIVATTTTDVTCSGTSTGSATIAASGGISPYSYLWSGGGTNATENNLAAGTYSVTVTDVNGCAASSNATINEPAVFTGNMNYSICQGDSILLEGYYQATSGTYYDTLVSANGCDSIIASTLTVGPVYSSTINAVICPGDSIFVGGYYQSSSGTYSDTLTGIFGCDSVINTILTFNGFANVISGVVFYNGSPITSGEVRLIQKNGNSPQSMVDMDSMFVNTDGSYLFDNIPPGNYLVKALGDTILYSNVATYADSSNHWQDGTNINFGINCGDTIGNVNVYLIDFPTTIGFGNIHGSIIHGGPGKTGGNGAFLGDPIPGLDVSLEQVPGNIVVGFDKTDINGKFSFDNIPIGNYRIYVDIPGYIMDTISMISYDSDNINFDYQLQVCLIEDSITAEIQVCEIAYVGKEEVNLISESSLYPNPASTKMLVSLYSIEEGIISLEFVNYLGQVVEKKQIGVHNGYNSIENDLNKFSNGIYTLKISTDKEEITRKLVISK